METRHIYCRDPQDDKSDDNLEQTDEPDPREPTRRRFVLCIDLHCHSCDEKGRSRIEREATITARFDDLRDAKAKMGKTCSSCIRRIAETRRGCSPVPFQLDSHALELAPATRPIGTSQSAPKRDI